MQAIQIDQTGGPEVLNLTDIPNSPPATGEAQVRLTYAGLNFVDVYQRQGGRQAPRLPAVLGKEGAGVVTALGEGLTGLTIGQRVAFGTAARGA